MFRRSYRGLQSSARAAVVVFRAGFNNVVTPEALAQFDQLCNNVWPPSPRLPSRKVTVLGAGSDVGRIVCLFLKQQNVIKILAMHDEVVGHKVVGHATDLSSIDTSTQVEVYQGRVFLKDALHDSDVVLICGGQYVQPPCCNILDRELFQQNLHYVRRAALSVAKFCPYAVVAVQVPPVDCNFALVKRTLQMVGVHDRRRLIGVNSISSMRANQLYAKYSQTDPEDSYVPVVCGACRCTRVPVFSSAKSFHCIPKDQLDFIPRLIREADDFICLVKGNGDQGHLSIGFATARCVVNVMKGIHEKPAFIDSALVDQDDVAACWGMKTCATPITIGRDGVITYHIPRLNDKEKDLLKFSKCDLKNNLNLGRCYAVGDDYVRHPCKVQYDSPPPPCETCKPCGDSEQRRLRSK